MCWKVEEREEDATERDGADAVDDMVAASATSGRQG